jgi:uncharacterized protein
MLTIGHFFMLKIVLDTNILIDGSGDDYNYGNRIIDEVIAGKIKAYANKSTLRENKLLASRKITDLEYLQKLDIFFATVLPVDFLTTRLNVVSDPEDNKILESALAASAKYLVTSDKHLLTLQEYNAIKIVLPAQFWSIYEQETGMGWQKWLSDFINN